MSDAELHENPLVPNKKLRQMYLAMLEARVLGEHLAGGKAEGKRRRGRGWRAGEEACRVSTAIDLVPGDLVSDSRAGGLDGVVGKRAGKVPGWLGAKSASGMRAEAESGRQMPWAGVGGKDAGERLRLAVGAALSFKTLKRANVVVAYVGRGEVGRREWRKVLEIASKLEAPIFFVVLPGDAGRKKKDAPGLNRLARSCGVPGMVADAKDAVALYRVTQETMGRLRGGGGPVLLECVAYELNGEREAGRGDAVEQMKGLLLNRKVATKGWLDAAGDDLRRRIAKV